MVDPNFVVNAAGAIVVNGAGTPVLVVPKSVVPLNEAPLGLVAIAAEAYELYSATSVGAVLYAMTDGSWFIGTSGFISDRPPIWATVPTGNGYANAAALATALWQNERITT